MSPPPTVQRALELAASGKVLSLKELEKALEREGCDGVRLHLSGTMIRREIRDAMRQARALRQLK